MPKTISNTSPLLYLCRIGVDGGISGLFGDLWIAASAVGYSRRVRAVGRLMSAGKNRILPFDLVQAGNSWVMLLRACRTDS